MAHIVFTALPAWGHLNPTLPLVRELTARGHRVTYAVAEPFRTVCEEAGASFRPLGSGSPERPPAPSANPVRLSSLLLDVTTAFLPDLLAVLDESPADLVVHDSMAPWGRFAADLRGVPRVCSSTTFVLRPEVFRAVSGSGGLLRMLVEGLPHVPALWSRRARLRRRYAVTGLSTPELMGNGGAPTLVYTAPELQPRADLVGTDVSFVGPVVPPPRVDVGPWVPEGDGPLVYASLGTLVGGREDFFATCVDAARRAGWRLVLSVGSPEQVERLGPLPDHVRAYPSVPQVELLDRTDAFITHAGMNGVHEALLARVPMVCIPQQMEQRVVAHQVSTHGLGVTVADRPSAEDLVAAVEGVRSDPETARRITAMARCLTGAGGVARAADVVEGVLGRPAPQGGLR